MILLTNPPNFNLGPYLHYLNQSTNVQAPISNFICCCLRPYTLKSGHNHQYRLLTSCEKNNARVFQKEKARSSKIKVNNSWEKPDVYDSHDDEDEAEANLKPDEDAQLIKEVELMLNPEERAILQENVSPDFKRLTSPKWIPLHTLATSGQILLMDDVLRRGIDVNSVDKYGLTALQKAVLCKKEAVFSRLLKRGANLHVRDKDGASLLHYAVLVGALQTTKLLIKENIDVNLADNEGWTPLHLAVQSRVRDVAKILLINGADKTIKNKDGNTPFDVAISLGKGFKTYEITKLLKLVPATGV